MKFKEALESWGLAAGAVQKFGRIRLRRKDDSLFSGYFQLHPLMLENERALVAVMRERKPDQPCVLELIDKLRSTD